MSEVKTKRDIFEEEVTARYPQLAGLFHKNQHKEYTNKSIANIYKGFMLAIKCQASAEGIPEKGRFVIANTVQRDERTFAWHFGFKPHRHQTYRDAKTEQSRLAEKYPTGSFTVFKIINVVDGKDSPFKFPVIQKETPQEGEDVNAVILSTSVLEQNGLVDNDGEKIS